MLSPDGSGVEVPLELRPLSWLIGRWVGVGTGQYPTIDDFRFGQEVSFATDGRPFLAYYSRSWLLDDDGQRVRPLALESGFWRMQGSSDIEVTLAHPTGYAEVWFGSLEVTALENATTGVTCNAICPGWVLTPLVQKQVDAKAAAIALGGRPRVEVARHRP